MEIPVRFFAEAKNVIDTVKTKLEDAGYNVEPDKDKWDKDTNNTTLFTVSIESIEAEDVKEMRNGRMSLAIPFRHYFATDSSLMEFINTLNADVFDDYSLDGSIIGMKFSRFQNFWQDMTRKRSVCVLWFNVVL